MSAPPVALPVAAPVKRAAPKPLPVAAQAPTPPKANNATLQPQTQSATSQSSTITAHSSSSSSSSSTPPSSSSHSNEEMMDAKLLMDLPDTHVYSLKEGTKRLAEHGKLQVMLSMLEGEEVYILVIGKFTLALRSEVPCVEMAPRNYVFPTDQKTFGIVIADSITADVFEVFHMILSEHTGFRVAAETKSIADLPNRTDAVVKGAHSVSHGLHAGSVVVASGVIKGGQIVGRIITKGGDFLRSHLKKNEKPSTVSDKTKSRIAQAKILSGCACKVSKALVMGAMATTQVLSKQIAEAVRDTSVGQKIESVNESKNSERVDAAKDVGRSALGAVLNIYEALETAVFGIGRDLSAASVTVITHKYGEETGKVTEEAISVAGNVVHAARDMKSIGVKSIAKKAAIGATHDLLSTKEEREAKEAATSQSSSSHSAVNLHGVDPVTALEAALAVSQLQQAAHSSSAAPRAPSDVVTVVSAAAFANSPEEAQRLANNAANQAAHKQ